MGIQATWRLRANNVYRHKPWMTILFHRTLISIQNIFLQIFLLTFKGLVTLLQPKLRGCRRRAEPVDSDGICLLKLKTMSSSLVSHYCQELACFRPIWPPWTIISKLDLTWFAHFWSSVLQSCSESNFYNCNVQLLHFCLAELLFCLVSRWISSEPVSCTELERIQKYFSVAAGAKWLQ